uniref:Uncharacterized protein n=1 Tax=Arundo donax TaxID=35708 RepID=A0A0A9CGM6_ARUDO
MVLITHGGSLSVIAK